MKMRSVVLSVMMLLFVFSSFADTYEYPGDDPLFSISFPDSWKVSVDDELLAVTPPDESLYLALWALDDADDLDAALEALEDVVNEFVDDLEMSEAEELEINGIEMVYVEGEGITEDDVDVNITAAMFSPDGDMICILFYFGTPESEDAYENELTEILESLELK